MTVFPGDSGLRQIYGEPGGRERGIEVETGNPAATPALVAALQVQEAVKLLTGIGEPLRERLLYLDTLSGEASLLKLAETGTEEHKRKIPAAAFRAPSPISFVGTSGSGKTTLLVELIAELAGRGLKVAAAKHSHAWWIWIKKEKTVGVIVWPGPTALLLSVAGKRRCSTTLRPKKQPRG